MISLSVDWNTKERGWLFLACEQLSLLKPTLSTFEHTHPFFALILPVCTVGRCPTLGTHMSHDEWPTT